MMLRDALAILVAVVSGVAAGLVGVLYARFDPEDEGSLGDIPVDHWFLIVMSSIAVGFIAWAVVRRR